MTYPEDSQLVPASIPNMLAEFHHISAQKRLYANITQLIGNDKTANRSTFVHSFDMLEYIHVIIRESTLRARTKLQQVGSFVNEARGYAHWTKRA